MICFNHHKNNTINKYVLFIKALPFLFLSTSLYADINNSQEVTTATQNTTINSTLLGTAQDWGLTPDEWVHYQTLMQGANGKWYPQLSPAAVLGLNAQTPKEQQHFAEIVAKEEHDKLAHELSFDTAVHQALAHLYVNEPVIRPFDMRAFNPIQSGQSQNTVTLQNGDHLVLFVDISKGLDFSVLPRLLAEINKNPRILLDIFCVAAPADTAISEWAKLNTIPHALVSAGRITLNRDDGRLQKTAAALTLPYVLLVHNGQSRIISSWSLP